jgi:hypothetical protein
MGTKNWLNRIEHGIGPCEIGHEMLCAKEGMANAGLGPVQENWSPARSDSVPVSNIAVQQSLWYSRIHEFIER